MPLQASLLKSLLCQRCCRSLSLVGKFPSSELLHCQGKTISSNSSCLVWLLWWWWWCMDSFRAESWGSRLEHCSDGRCVALRTRATWNVYTSGSSERCSMDVDWGGSAGIWTDGWKERGGGRWRERERERGQGQQPPRQQRQKDAAASASHHVWALGEDWKLPKSSNRYRKSPPEPVLPWKTVAILQTCDFFNFLQLHNFIQTCINPLNLTVPTWLVDHVVWTAS